MDAFTSIDKNVATNVRHWREVRGLSQEELAQRMTDRGFGFTQATVWKIEQGKRPLRISETVALTNALELRAWSNLTAEPAEEEHIAELEQMNSRAYEAYDRIKAAATDYIEAQLLLTVSLHRAYEAGLKPSTLWSSWLDTPPERAVIEARIQGDQEEENRERLDEAVDQVVETLRERGFEAMFHPDQVEVEEGGSLPRWQPGQASGQVAGDSTT